jgi:hypothetical protein
LKPHNPVQVNANVSGLFKGLAAFLDLRIQGFLVGSFCLLSKISGPDRQELPLKSSVPAKIFIVFKALGAELDPAQSLRVFPRARNCDL